MSVDENLQMGAYKRADKKAIRDDLERVYHLFPALAGRRRQLAGSLSGGSSRCAQWRGPSWPGRG